MTRKKIEFEVGSGNVFADLGLEDAEELYTRAALGVQVMKILTERGLSQKDAAEILDIKRLKYLRSCARDSGNSAKNG